MGRKPKRDTDEAADDTLRPLWPTAAEPVTFAPPVDVSEEGSQITLVFDLGAAVDDGVEVELREGTLVVLGRRRALGDAARARRVYSFGSPVDPSSVQTSVTGTLLSVRLTKASRKGIVVRSR